MHLFLSAPRLCVLGADLEGTGTGGHPQGLFPAQGTASPSPPPGPALAQQLPAPLRHNGRAEEERGEISRGKWRRELRAGERHRMPTKEPAECLELDWTHGSCLVSPPFLHWCSLVCSGHSCEFSSPAQTHWLRLIGAWTEPRAHHWGLADPGQGKERACPNSNPIFLASVAAAGSVPPAQ